MAHTVTVGGKTVSIVRGSSSIILQQVINFRVTSLGGTTNDKSYGLDINSLNDIFITGDYFVSGFGPRTLLAKYDSDGVLQWQKGLNGADSGKGVKVNSIGEIYVSGYTNAGAGSRDLFIAKYDSSGSILWQRSIGTSGFDTNVEGAIDIDSSDNVYFSGYTVGTNRDAFIAKYNSSGVIQWQKTLSTVALEDDYFNDVMINGSDVYACGRTYSQGQGGADALFAKYDLSGTLVWQRILGGTGLLDTFNDMAIDSLGNVYLAGSTNSVGVSLSTLLIAKYNSSGTLLWQKMLNGISSDQLQGLSITINQATSSIYIGGVIDSDIVIAKYDFNGSLDWQKTISGASGVNVCHDLELDSFGNIFIAGLSSSIGEGNDEIILLGLSDSTIDGTYGGLTITTSTLINSISTLTSATSTLTAANGIATDQVMNALEVIPTLVSVTTEY